MDVGLDDSVVSDGYWNSNLDCGKKMNRQSMALANILYNRYDPDYRKYRF
jgi:hypothetical protein